MKVKCSGCGLVVHRPKDGMKHTGCKNAGFWVRAEAADVAIGHKAAHVRQPKEIDPDAPLPEPRQKKSKKERTPATAAVPGSNDWVPDEDYFLWSRGAWRGWAVAAKVDEIQRLDIADEEGNIIDPLLKLETDYGKVHECMDERIRQEVREGKIYIIEPGGVIELLQHQMLRLTRSSAVPPERAELLESVLLSLADCAAAIEALKAAS